MAVRWYLKDDRSGAHYSPRWGNPSWSKTNKPHARDRNAVATKKQILEHIEEYGPVSSACTVVKFEVKKGAPDPTDVDNGIAKDRYGNLISRGDYIMQPYPSHVAFVEIKTIRVGQDIIDCDTYILNGNKDAKFCVILPKHMYKELNIR